MSYSQAEQRQAFADALTGITADVDGVTVTVTGYPVQPVTVAPYAAWPIWSATRPLGTLGGCVPTETDWLIALALPGADAQTWSANGDPLTDAVLAALADRYNVERVEPGQVLVAGGGAVPCLRFTITGA